MTEHADNVKTLMRVAEHYHTYTFQYQGKTVQYDQLLAANGLLPAFVNKANILSRFLFDLEFTTFLYDEKDALLGQAIKMKDKDQEFVFAMIVIDIIEEGISQADSNHIPLDGVL